MSRTPAPTHSRRPRDRAGTVTAVALLALAALIVAGGGATGAAVVHRTSARTLLHDAPARLRLVAAAWVSVVRDIGATNSALVLTPQRGIEPMRALRLVPRSERQGIPQPRRLAERLLALPPPRA